MSRQGRITLRSKIMAGYIVILLCLGSSLFLLSNRITSMEQAIDFVTDHDMTVHDLAGGLEKHLLDMETGMRGFVITGEERYLEPYDAAMSNWVSDYDQLHRLVGDNSGQRQKLEAIKANIERWIETAGEPALANKRNGRQAELDTFFQADTGKKITDELRSQLEDFRDTEKELTAARVDSLDRQNSDLRLALAIIFLLLVALSVAASLTISGAIVRTVKAVIGAISDIADTEGGTKGRRVEVQSRDELRDLGDATNRLLEKQEGDAWLQSGIAEIAVSYQGQPLVSQLAEAFIAKLAGLMGASYGVFYLRSGDRLARSASYAAGSGEVGAAGFRLGEGLIGQCAVERRVYEVDRVPDDHIKIATGLGQSSPRSILIFPIEHEGRVEGVIELASLDAFTSLHRKLVDQTRSTLGMAINNVLSQMEVKRLLEESQTMSEELQAQTEELQQQAEELKAQSEELTAQQDELRAANDALKRSEDDLKRQQEELEDSNLELTKRSELIAEHARRVEEINERIEMQNSLLERQAVDLKTASRYKSEFLANMSHELRTPLNSLLILSQLLAENKEGNLFAKQIEFAQTIHSSGSDLLRLIDEILDLSKVEAGQMTIELQPLVWEELADGLERGFRPLAERKGIELSLKLEETALKEPVVTDAHRLQQILKNLLSNAFKFTSKGKVELSMLRTVHPELGCVVAFKVADTGVGIPADKKAIIFEAFQQADGSTSRKYGGTGLGLTISRELAALLGGRIEVESAEGVGSVFTLLIPGTAPEAEATAREEIASAGGTGGAGTGRTALGAESDSTSGSGPGSPLKPDLPLAEPSPFGRPAARAGFAPAPAADVLAPAIEWTSPELLEHSEVPDDRHRIQPGDKVLLIIEDDIHFAKIMLDLARSRSFKAIVALQGDTGLALASAYKPDAVILDIQLPVLDGWSILDRMKQNPELRHIPVHVISVVDEPQQGLTKGAMAYLRKPADKASMESAMSRIESFLDRGLKRLLIVEDDVILRSSMVELIGHDDVAITAVSTGEEALKELDGEPFDCMVMDLGLADMTGFELLDRIRKNERLRQLPIIIYTGKDLDMKEEIELKKYAESIIIKNVKSQERLFDETALFLHRVEANLPEDRRNILKKLYNNETAFEGKRVLLVEDDIRNIFALTNVLKSHHLNVSFAENGREALELLEQDPSFDLVLMDIMMPEMDGYETMRAIRRMPPLEKLPIIALTAKAMKEDRMRCIEAGASDYISKPIDIDKLLSLLKVWLYA
ncbi:response regulator [Cohnella fermenti]|uniref:Circadian input-output histidine kinase CikA n=1 Tax=Cohnella fermenti TaxID=2565925 RepID=A0A4S4C396_9BACL|nr:response regulator [Cohnella fermenti]THF82208.1 response regulator [Cohnella fermenti]